MCVFLVQIVVNAIVGTLKTAFPRSEPQSPTEDNDSEVDAGKVCTDKKSKYVMPFVFFLSYFSVLYFKGRFFKVFF